MLEELDHVAISVTDVMRSISWYRDVLGLEKRHEEWGTSDTISMRHLAFRADRGHKLEITTYEL
jgi:catechol 2,3-dioxygenase-like lactoylglutathione lyase family enzyme